MESGGAVMSALEVQDWHPALRSLCPAALSTSAHAAFQERHLEDLLVHHRAVADVAVLAEELAVVGRDDHVCAARALLHKLTE